MFFGLADLVPRCRRSSKQHIVTREPHLKKQEKKATWDLLVRAQVGRDSYVSPVLIRIAYR